MRRCNLFDYLACVALLVPICGWAAGDVCRPVAVLQAQDALTLDVPTRGSTPRLEATLARDVTVKADLTALGLAAQPGEQTLAQRVVIPKHVLGYRDLVGNRGKLVFDGEKSGQMVVKGAGRHLLLKFQDGVPQTADGQPLEVVPPLFKETRFSVLEGARIRSAGAGEVVILQGSKIAWLFDTRQPLELGLPQSVRLEETTSGKPVQRLTVVRPLRVAPGGVIHVQVSAPNFDVRTKPLAFCFVSMTPAAQSLPVASERTKLISQTGDVATFAVEVPTFEALVLSSVTTPAVDAQSGSSALDLGLWRRLTGFSATVRAIGLDGDIVLVDISDRLRISSARVAALISLAVLFVMFVLSALWLRRLNPFAIVGALIRHESGRYSLSNLQIFMWTVLVIFALCFNWITTGELLDISPGILVLLGISGTSTVLARTIDAQKDHSLATMPTTGSSIKDLVTSEDGSGKFDLLRFQMLGFTLFTWLYVLVSVLRSQGLPEIPESFYVLMGISNTAYIGGKLPGVMGDKPQSSSAPASANDLPPSESERLLTEPELKRVQAALGVPGSGVIDTPTRDAVKQFKLGHGIAPANGRLDQLVMEKIQAEKS